MDVHDELEAAFAGEPAHRPVDDRLLAGRRALRRRRLSASVAAAATVAVIATAATVTGLGGDPSSRDQGVATNPTDAPSPPADAPSPPAPDDDHAVEEERAPWAQLSRTGAVELRDDIVEVRRIDNPLEVSPPQHSVALELQKGDTVKWFLLGSDRGTEWSSSFGAYVGFASLEDWVADQRLLQAGKPAKSYVEFADDGSLRPVDGRVELVRQQANPDLPDNYGGGVETVVAEVVVDDDTYYVLARDPRHPDFITVPAIIGGRTMADFLDYARAQYAGGEGLR